ncbi:hypothetical protein ACMXYV_08630 [Neptuniibacter sp. SY11_33]|uniref:hypothetical protein n=1 Tax=Neptuniibacter sp. SY11_33 TaxID=3398215 RepID=UPI0039F45332
MGSWFKKAMVGISSLLTVTGVSSAPLSPDQEILNEQLKVKFSELNDLSDEELKAFGNGYRKIEDASDGTTVYIQADYLLSSTYIIRVLIELPKERASYLTAYKGIELEEGNERTVYKTHFGAESKEERDVRVEWFNEK